MCGIRSKVSEQMSYKQLAILFPKLAHIPPELDKIPTYYQDLWGITVNAKIILDYCSQLIFSQSLI